MIYFNKAIFSLFQRKKMFLGTALLNFSPFHLKKKIRKVL